MMLRRIRRALSLALALAGCIWEYWLARLRGPMTLERRALWLHQSSRSVLASLNVRFRVEGIPPASGLVVSNHLSYLDIPMFSAIMPCFFVAKAEVDGWTFFGKAARSGGTLFLDRANLASANRVAEQMEERLRMPVPVLLFPEGTSTDGRQVLHFHSRLIHPATEVGAPITAAAIRYESEDGPGGRLPESELCWFGDVGFLSHLWKVLGVRSFSATVRFAEPRIYSDRRAAAEQTRDSIIAMRADGGERPTACMNAEAGAGNQER